MSSAGSKIPFIVALLASLKVSRAWDPSTTPMNQLKVLFPNVPLAPDVSDEEYLLNIFRTPIRDINSHSAYVILNVREYGPLSVIKTGHVFLIAQDSAGNLGSIGFYPKNYSSVTGLIQSVWGAEGVLVTPDPIAKKYSKMDDVAAGNFQVLKWGAKPISTDNPGGYEKLNVILRGKKETNRNTDVYMTDSIYQPLSLARGENCYTYLEQYLGFDLEYNSNDGMLGGVPNMNIPGDFEATSPVQPVQPVGTAGGFMQAFMKMIGQGQGGGSTKRTRRKSKKKRNNNNKKTRRKSKKKRNNIKMKRR